MGLPNADRAVVEDAKVRDYLLSPTHPVGRFKSVFFAALGFSANQWPVLRDALLELARAGNVSVFTKIDGVSVEFSDGQNGRSSSRSRASMASSAASL